MLVLFRRIILLSRVTYTIGIDFLMEKQKIVILIAFLILFLGYSINSFYPELSGFTIELNCTFPEIPEEMKILYIESRPINEEEVMKIAVNVFGFESTTTITYHNNRLKLSSGNKSLTYYVTDYIVFEDSSYERKPVDVDTTSLMSLGEEFIELLDVYWEEPTDTELVLERMEFPDLSLHSKPGQPRCEQPQYIVYYHHLNGTPVLSLSGEFNLGFADNKIVYTQISRLNIVNSTLVDITKTPTAAIMEAFPKARIGAGFGVASRALVPIRGKIYIESIRLFYYNWDSKIGENYELVPQYKIKALFVGPDINGKIQSGLQDRVIKATE